MAGILQPVLRQILGSVLPNPNSALWEGRSLPAWVLPGAALDLYFAESLGYNSLNLATTTPDSILTYTNPSAKMVYGSDGVLTYRTNNLILQSQTFDTTWAATNTVVTANQATAPDGTLTADLVKASNTSSLTHRLGQTVSDSGKYLYSLYVKSAGYTRCGIWDYATTGGTVTFNLSGSGSVIEQLTGAANAAIVDVGSGWFRISFTLTSAASVGFAFQMLPDTYIAGGGINNPWVANTSDGFYLWGAQLERVTTATTAATYIPTTTAAKYSLPIDHNPTTFEPLGVLIEEQRTNLALYSDDFTNAAWTPTNLTTAKTATGPDGVTNSASTLTATAANATARQNVTSASAARITSMFVKRRTGTGAVYLSQGGTTGSELVVNGTFTTDTTGWTASGATLAVVSSELELTNTGDSPGYADSDVFATVVGTAYLVGYTARRGTSSSIDIQVRKTTGGAETSVTLTNTSNVDGFLYFIASSTSTFIRVSANQAVLGRTGYFDNLSVKAAVETTVTVTSDWTRVATASATVTNPPLIIRMATSGDAIDVDLFQHELGAFITSPIPTVASQVTRLADQVSILTSAFGYNAAAGTIVSESDTGQMSASVYSYIASLGDGGGTERIVMRSLGATASFAVVDGGVPQVASNISGTVVLSVPFKLALAYKVNDFAATLDGGTVVTDDSGTLPTVTTLKFGADGGAAASLNGHIKRLTYFPTRRTDADLQVLTRGDDLVWGAGDYLVWGSGNNLTW